MTAPVEVRWALYGKEPGDKQDFHVVADDSDGGLTTEYDLLVSHLITGNAKERPTNLAEALPWASFAPLGSSAGDRFAAAVTEWPASEVRDSDGRKTAFTRYFDISLADLLTFAPSYRDLHASAGGQPLPGPPRLTISLDEPRPAEIARSIDQHGLGNLLLVAASLLEGTVVLTNAPPGIDERLRFLDAVASLLPYGARADLAVGTWSPNVSVKGQPLRLFFSDVVDRGQRAWAFGEPTNAPPRTQVAIDYVERVARLYRAMGAVELVATLWALRKPQRLGDPAAVLDSLSPFDLPYAVWQDVRRGAGIGAVRAMLARDSLPMAEHEVWSGLVRFIADHGTDADLRSLAQHWCPPIPMELARLVTERGAEWGMAAMQIAIDAHQHEGFVEHLLAAGRSGVTAGEHVVDLLSRWNLPPSGRLGTALLAEPDTATRLLLASARPARGTADGWLDVLRAAPTAATVAWLRPYVEVADVAPVLTKETVEQAARVGEWAMLALLAFAVRRRAEHTVLGSVQAFGELWRWLGKGSDRLRRECVDVLIGAGHLVGRARVTADLLLVAAGGTPPWRGHSPPSDPAAYRAETKEMVDRMGDPLATQTLRTLVESALFLRPLTEEAADFAIDLAQIAPRDEGRNALLTRVADSAAANPSALRRQPRTMIGHLQMLSPELKSRSVLLGLAPAAEDGVHPTELAALCAKALHAEIGLDQVLASISPWPHWTHPERTHEFLRALADAYKSPKPKHVKVVYQTAVRHVLSQGYGEQAATAYRAWLTRRILTEERMLPVEKKSLHKVKPPRRRPGLFGRLRRRSSTSGAAS